VVGDSHFVFGLTISKSENYVLSEIIHIFENNLNILDWQPFKVFFLNVAKKNCSPIFTNFSPSFPEGPRNLKKGFCVKIVNHVCLLEHIF
jgi:hypothetical protein